MRKAMLLLAVFGLVGTLFAADNQWTGTWKLNLAKSKISDPSMMPKSETIKVVAQGNDMKTTVDGVDAQGKAFHSAWSGKWDGKNYPVTGDPDVDMSAITQIDNNTVTVLNKKAGKEVITYRVTLSKDRKTQTLVAKTKDAKGQEVNISAVYDKQ